MKWSPLRWIGLVQVELLVVLLLAIPVHACETRIGAVSHRLSWSCVEIYEFVDSSHGQPLGLVFAPSAHVCLKHFTNAREMLHAWTTCTGCSDGPTQKQDQPLGQIRFFFVMNLRRKVFLFGGDGSPKRPYFVQFPIPPFFYFGVQFHFIEEANSSAEAKTTNPDSFRP